MKKTIIAALAALLGSTAPLAAAHVDRATAREAAAQFLREINPQAVLETQAVHRAPRTNADGTTDASGDLYYVFNAALGQGYVIISGDDRTPQVLGYAPQGSVDADHMPEALRELLDSYAAQLRELDAMSEAESHRALAAHRAPIATRNSISPLITTLWDQARPYWNKCPQFMVEEGSDEFDLAYTGCVATSMAQIMNFHRYPTQTTQAIPSYSFTYGDNYDYATVNTEELPVVTFDWDHMLDTYTGAEDEVYTDAVATLMQYCGYAVKMVYGKSSSGAYTDDIPSAFKNYFDYDANTLRIVYRNDYTLTDWRDLIYAELAEGRPMIYNGTAGSGGGHSFICDGYEMGDYFHINWGWGGMSDGFYLLEILNPHASGIGGASSSEGYNMKQNAIIGLQPNQGGGSGSGTTTSSNLYVTNLYCGYNSSSTTFERDRQSDPFKINKSHYLNYGRSDHDGNGQKFACGIDLYDATGTTLVEHIYGENVYTTVTNSATGTVFSVGKGVATNASITFGKGLAAGTYRIVPVCQLQGSSEWVPMIHSDRYYFELTVTATMATAKCHPDYSLTASNYQFTGGEKVGKAERVDVTIRNTGSERFFGDLYLFVDGENIDEFGQYTTVVQAEVGAGEETVVTFNFTPKAAGSKSVHISLDDQDYKKLSGSSSVTIAAVEDVPMNLSVVIEATNAVDGVIYDSHADFRASITNHAEGEYARYILAPLFLVSKDEAGNVTGGNMVTYKMETIQLAAGETRDFYFAFDNLAVGSTYSLNIYARNDEPDDSENAHTTNIVEKGHSVYYDIRPGVITWTSDGQRRSAPLSGTVVVPDDATAVSLCGLGDDLEVTPGPNLNCLYFLDAEQAVPAGLAEGCNVVRGNTATRIQLFDGYDYYTPTSFKASEISYTRTFTQGRSSQSGESGWSTIVLPFAASSFTDANGTDLRPFQGDDDANGRFWLCSFSGEEGDETSFDYASSLQADRPYLIAVPDGSWSAPSLVGATLVFQATDVTLKPSPTAVTSGRVHALIGTYRQQRLADIYTLSGLGHQFAAGEGQQRVDAFRAYFTTLDGQTSEATELPILFRLTGEVDTQQLGDVNGDGRVDILDITCLVDILRGQWSADAPHGDTDLNVDDQTDDDDLTHLVEMILAAP